MAPNKTCEQCGKTYPATEKYFGLNLRSKDGHKNYCRECSPAVNAERRKRKAERSREWARNNPEKVRASARRTYERNRRERLAYFKRWRQENKARTREYNRRYREKQRRGEG